MIRAADELRMDSLKKVSLELCQHLASIAGYPLTYLALVVLCADDADDSRRPTEEQHAAVRDRRTAGNLHDRESIQS